MTTSSHEQVAAGRTGRASGLRRMLAPLAAASLLLAGLPAAQAQAYEGSVVKVDRAQGKVTIAHGEIAPLGLPAMTMAWRVADRSWLDTLAEGRRIRFDADKVAGNFTVTRLVVQP